METVLELKHWFVFKFNHIIWLVAFVLWFSGLCGWVPIIMGYKVEDRCSMFPTNTAMHVPECMALLLLTHCGPVTQICVCALQPCRTGDANLRF